jgi:NhaP-type Na+/H+ or K+/H+ antiporter
MVAVGTAEDVATHHEKAPAYMAEAVLAFNEQIERILEVALVLLVGAMLAPEFIDLANFWFVPMLLLAIRPLAVYLGLAGIAVERKQHALMSWFGIRGIGSLYYLMYALSHGVPEEIARPLVSLTLWVIAASVFVHGISVTPLMHWYKPRRARSGRSRQE